MSRAIPWVLSIILAVMLGITWFHLNAQVQKKDAELSDLRSKYDQLVLNANGKIEEANKRYNDLVADANRKIQAASQPQAEVFVSFRKAFLSSGSVAGIRSTSNRAIAVSVEIERPSSGAKKSYELTLDPGQEEEIGELEGWAFVSGDRIRISQADHKALTFIAP